MSPLEFMQRLAARVPRPQLQLLRFHGVLAPNAKLHSLVMPQGPPAQAVVAAELAAAGLACSAGAVSLAALARSCCRNAIAIHCFDEVCCHSPNPRRTRVAR